MRALLIATVALLGTVSPAAALLSDDEPSNDSVFTAAIQITRGGAVITEGGSFLLATGGNDIDLVGIGGLLAGDVVTLSTTPLVDPPDFESPDTIVGLFDSNGTQLCVGDDAYNSDLDPFPTGLGSLCRLQIPAAGDYFVGITGFSAVPFDGAHPEEGIYSVTVTVEALGAGTPTPTPTSTPTATPTGTPSATPTASPTATPTGAPTSTPTASPTATPTASPTATPTGAPTSTPTVSPTGTPTATPSATPPLCLNTGPCNKNSDCCTNICSGPGGAKTCEPPPTPTPTPTGTPTATPTATPTPTAPLCVEIGPCNKNSDCCSNECSGPGGAKICEPPPTPTATPTPTPEPGAALQLVSGAVGLAWLQRRRSRRGRAKTRS